MGGGGGVVDVCAARRNFCGFGLWVLACGLWPAGMRRVVRAFGGPVKRGSVLAVWVDLMGWLGRRDGVLQDEHESLILAQNERWRHA